jgi:hypothetical protein
MPVRAVEPPPAKKLDTTHLVDDTRAVLDAIVQAAAENRDLPEPGAPGAGGPFRRRGDDLTVYYVRTAAKAADQLPSPQRAASAHLLALGIALDDSTMLRDNLLTRALWRSIEPEKARERRLKVLGEPTLQGRHDLAQHFAVSAALTALSGPESARGAGILKEVLDARPGGSGFSFADLSADLAGITYARQVLATPSTLGRLTKSFTVAAYTLPPEGLPEGLSQAEFARQYGSISDERFLRRLEEIQKRVDALPGYKAVAP